jgi:hypothetical protein
MIYENEIFKKIKTAKNESFFKEIAAICDEKASFWRQIN